MALNNFEGFTNSAGFITESRWNLVWSCGSFFNLPVSQGREGHTAGYLVPCKSTAFCQSSCSFITINHCVNGTLTRQWTFIQEITWSPVESFGLIAVQQRSKKTAVNPGSTKCSVCVCVCARLSYCKCQVSGVQGSSQTSAAPSNPHKFSNSRAPRTCQFFAGPRVQEEKGLRSLQKGS